MAYSTWRISTAPSFRACQFRRVLTKQTQERRSPNCLTQSTEADCVRRHSLLDSYRQEKGEAVSSERRHNYPPKRTRHPRNVSEPSKRSNSEDADDALCTPECVKEISSADEFGETLETAHPDTLIVVDFYKTACGSCRYIQPGFVKLCHNSEEEHAPVMFLKHNVIDEADQETDLCEQLKIRNVPLFQFYKDNALLEQFATREKKRIGNAINMHVGRDVCHI